MLYASPYTCLDRVDGGLMSQKAGQAAARESQRSARCRNAAPEADSGDPMDGEDLVRLNEPGALAVLCAVLSKVFSYPTVSQAQDLADVESMEYCTMLAGRAGVNAGDLRDAEAEFAQASAGFGRLSSERAVSPVMPGQIEGWRQIRLDMTRLFFSPLTGIPMEGRHWVPKGNRDWRAAQVGERASVARAYADCGFRLAAKVSTQEDSLDNELEFVSLLASREARALAGADSVTAARCRDLRREFFRCHLRDLGTGVAGRIMGESSSPHLRYYAQVLLLALDRIGE